jgi:hypothetical protein
VETLVSVYSKVSAVRLIQMPEQAAQLEGSDHEQGNQLIGAGRAAQRRAEGETVQLLEPLKEVEGTVEAAHGAQLTHSALAPLSVLMKVGTGFATPPPQPLGNPPEEKKLVLTKLERSRLSFRKSFLERFKNQYSVKFYCLYSILNSPHFILPRISFSHSKCKQVGFFFLRLYH